MARDHERLINVKHEVTKLLNRLQELVSYFIYIHSIRIYWQLSWYVAALLYAAV